MEQAAAAYCVKRILRLDLRFHRLRLRPHPYLRSYYGNYFRLSPRGSALGLGLRQNTISDDQPPSIVCIFLSGQDHPRLQDFRYRVCQKGPIEGVLLVRENQLVNFRHPTFRVQENFPVMVSIRLKSRSLSNQRQARGSRDFCSA